ncbi:hypothetical protein Aph02nite_65630 [Actinoplanes philippinensis]|nr:hypothetical protein Aph02nite_65630 [Actinoplanes philippinensis]
MHCGDDGWKRGSPAISRARPNAKAHDGVRDVGSGRVRLECLGWEDGLGHVNSVWERERRVVCVSSRDRHENTGVAARVGDGAAAAA